MPVVLEQEQKQIKPKKGANKMEDLKATGQIAADNKPRPIQLVIALLSEMTERATEAERERDEQKERADEWYRHYCTKNAMCQDLQKKLAEIERGQSNG